MKKLVEQVKQCGIDKGLHKVGHLAQAKYTLKETAELLDAYADSDQEKMNDAIGDILVTLIVGASNDEDVYKDFNSILSMDDIAGLKPTSQQYFYSIYMDLTGLSFSLESGIKAGYKGCYLLKEYRHVVYGLIDAIGYVNFNFNQSLSLQDCLQMAYNEIKDRTGKTNEDGHFIKD